MTQPQFSRPGAVDLSALKNRSSAGASGEGSYVLEITSEEQLRTEVVQRSMSAVVIMLFWRPDEPASVQLKDSLTNIANSSGGQFLFATLDLAAHADLGQTLGIPQVPLVVAGLRGQLAPLIQENVPEDQLRQVIDQVLQTATANGISGTVEPVGPPVEEEGEADTEPQSKYPEAEAALTSGDVNAAIAAYQQAVDDAPDDQEAQLGLARAQLLERTQGVDLQAARSSAAEKPDDVDAQTLVADLDLVGGHVEDAFQRLIDVVRRSSGEARDAARKHLVELFAVVGDDDPRVAKARQMLASALF